MEPAPLRPTDLGRPDPATGSTAVAQDAPMVGGAR
jgi:hypothetical protein